MNLLLLHRATIHNDNISLDAITPFLQVPHAYGRREGDELQFSTRVFAGHSDSLQLGRRCEDRDVFVRLGMCFVQTVESELELAGRQLARTTSPCTLA